jgi:hypothetical protein
MINLICSVKNIQYFNKIRLLTADVALFAKDVLRLSHKDSCQGFIDSLVINNAF